MSTINRSGSSSSSPGAPPPNPPPSSSFSSARAKARLQRHLAHLQTPLHPLLSISTGRPHAAFPRSLLHYHLLSEAQLDELAHWYHQRTPGPLSLSYPAPVIARWDRHAAIADKRRRFGRFIGLRGCDSPVRERALTVWARRTTGAATAGAESGAVMRRFDDDGDDEMELADAETQEEVERWIEARVRRAIEREREREMWRRKGF